jgi:uncharacterized coiled-coil DUF342 family protein
MHPLYTVRQGAAVKRGPLATVWLAQDEVLGRAVALKELDNWAARSARSQAAFRFAHLRRLSLNHEGLAPVHGADSGRGWIVLDHYAAGSLADRSGTFTPDHVRELLQQLLRTLAYLHAQGLVHGAVRPENLFLAQQGQVLLADGLGLRLDSEGRARDAGPCFERLDDQETKYLAPECLDGKADRVGHAADLYALGLTILELLLGRASFVQLFPGVQVAAQTWAEWHRSADGLPPLLDLLPEAPADLARVIDRLLLKDPGARPAAAEALAVLCPPPPEPPRPKPQLWGRNAPKPLAAPAPDVRPAPSPPALEVRGRVGARFVAAGAAVLGLGVVLGLLVRPGSRGEPAAALEEVAQARADLREVSAQLDQARATAEGHASRADRLEAELRGTRANLDQARAEASRAQGELAQAREVARRAEERAAILKGELEQARAVADRSGTSSARAQGELAQAHEGARRAEERAAALQGELERARSDAARAATQAAGLVGERDRALADLSKCKAAAARQDEELKRARAELAESGKRIAQLEGQLKEAGEPRRLPVIEKTPGRSAVVALEKLGGKVGLDAQKAHEDVVLEADLSGTKVTNDDLALLDGLSSLRVLSLASTRVADAGLTHLEGLAELRKLNLYDTQTTDAGLASLRGLTRLQTLCLATTKVSDKGLAHLKGLVNLQALSLTNTQTTNDGLVHLQGLVNLQTLHLSTTKVTDEGLAHLKGLSQLRTLHLNNTAVSGACLAHLKGMPSLQELQLSYTRINDQGLAYLKALTSLEEIDLTGTGVSPAAVAALRQALPRCRIQH